MAGTLDTLKQPIKIEEKKRFDALALKKFVANFLLPLISLGITLILFALVIYPSFSKVPELKNDLDNKKKLALQLESKYTKLGSLRDFKNSVEEYNTLITDVLVNEPLVPQLLTQIDLISKEAGITIDRLSYSTGDTGGQPKESKYSAVSISLGVSGTFEQLVTFLSTLENAGRIVMVNAIRYSAAQDEGQVTATLTVVSPYVQIETNAVTDDPISFDLTDKEFQDVMARLKTLKIYRIGVNEVIDISEVPQTTESAPTAPAEGAGETPPVSP